MAGPTTAEPGERQQPESGRSPRARVRLGRPGPAFEGPPVRTAARPRAPSAPRRLHRSRAAARRAASGLLYGSPWLRVERVTVSGTRVLTPARCARRRPRRWGTAGLRGHRCS